MFFIAFILINALLIVFIGTFIKKKYFVISFKDNFFFLIIVSQSVLLQCCWRKNVEVCNKCNFDDQKKKKKNQTSIPLPLELKSRDMCTLKKFSYFRCAPIENLSSECKFYNVHVLVHLKINVRGRGLKSEVNLWGAKHWLSPPSHFHFIFVSPCDGHEKSHEKSWYFIFQIQ